MTLGPLMIPPLLRRQSNVIVYQSIYEGDSRCVRAHKRCNMTVAVAPLRELDRLLAVGGLGCTSSLGSSCERLVLGELRDTFVAFA